MIISLKYNGCLANETEWACKIKSCFYAESPTLSLKKRTFPKGEEFFTENVNSYHTLYQTIKND